MNLPFPKSLSMPLNLEETVSEMLLDYACVQKYQKIRKITFEC